MPSPAQPPEYTNTSFAQRCRRIVPHGTARIPAESIEALRVAVERAAPRQPPAPIYTYSAVGQIPDWVLGDPDVAERFWSHAEADTDSSCLLWTGSRNQYGYGRLYFQDDGRDRRAYAHRYILARQLGRWPTGVVMHACDRPSCVNVAHLAEGTQSENISHSYTSGRRGRA